MKHIGAIFLFCSLAYGADFMTGQAARFTIGQANFTAQGDDPESGSELGAVAGVAYANNTLFVADSNRVQATPVYNRVLIYQNLNSLVPAPTATLPQGSLCPVCGGTANVVLGQTDFASANINLPPTANSLRTPTSVATDGTILVIADTDNNRVLIWNTIPTSNGTPANTVIGQPDFTHVSVGLSATGMRAPQGVWIQGTRLFVADTQNHRVLVWNNIPTTNGKAADYVLGEPNFSTAPSAQTASITPTASNLFYPVSATSDGQRLFVSDLGQNRVLIWNSIPTTTNQPADLVIGQPNFTTSTANNSSALCTSNGTDSTGAATYPARCANTLDTPRFALSDGQRLYISDGGNDRVLVYNTIPTQSGVAADVILGQPDAISDNVSDIDPTNNDTFRSASNSVRTPMELATDGLNLYVSDPFDRRVLVFTPGSNNIPTNGILNAASLAVYAFANVTIGLTSGGAIQAGDVLTVNISGTAYTYTVVSADTLANIIQNIVSIINGKNGTPDPNAIATANTGALQFTLTARTAGIAGDGVTLAVSVAGMTTSTTPTLTASASSSILLNGFDSSQTAPGTLITIGGSNLSDTTAAANPPAGGGYPVDLGGVELYVDGIKAPLLYVSPTQVNAQFPFDVSGRSSTSVFLRTMHADGSVTYTTAVAVPVVQGDPGLFAMAGTDPRPAIAYHDNPNGIALVDIGGTIVAKDTATIGVNGTNYTYTVQSTDTIQTVESALINLINADSNSPVTASNGAPPNTGTARIILTANTPGAAGNGIPVTTAVSASAMITVVADNSSTQGGNSLTGLPVDSNNPAAPGETIAFYATGLGLVLPNDAQAATNSGQLVTYTGQTYPATPVDSALVGNAGANVVQAGFLPGTAGIYLVLIQIATGLTTNPQTQVYIGQGSFISNTVTINVVAPSS